MCSSILMVLHIHVQQHLDGAAHGLLCKRPCVAMCKRRGGPAHHLFHTNAMWKRPCTAPSSTGPPVLITSAKKIKYLKTSSRFIVLCAKNRKGKRNDVAHYLINKRGHYVIKERAHYLIMVPLHATFVKQKWHVVFISYCA